MAEAQPPTPGALLASALPKLTLKQRLAARLQKSWTQRDGLSFVLLGVSYLYRGLVAVRRSLYARGIFTSERMPVPVIVVGNVVAGGAGKTPVVIDIVRDLIARGWQPGVVSGGYGRVVNQAAGSALEVTADTPVSISGDEPALIKHALASAFKYDWEAPVFVANQRADAAKALLAAYPQTNVIVCDDGLQHLALQRDVEVCVFDARGTGNGRLLPAGPLREPWPRSTTSSEPWPLSAKPTEPWPRSSKKPAVNFVLHTGIQAEGFLVHRKLADYAVRADGSRVPLAELRGKPLTALAAIAQPEAFFSMLRNAGLTLQETISLPDHYDFNSWLRNIDGGYSLICTQKDAVKLWQHAPDALAVPLQITIDPAFFSALHEALSSCVAKL